MQFRLPLYPFLLSLYFVFYIFYENLGEAFLGQTIRPIVVLFLVTGLLIFLFTRIFKNADKAAFVTFLLLALIFMHPSIETFAPAGTRQRTAVVLLSEITILVALAALMFRVFTNWSRLNQLLNAAFCVLLLLSVYRIADYGSSEQGVVFEPVLERKTISTEELQRPEGSLPNIYYIMVDAYTRSDVLQDYFGYDNSDFVSYLEDKGFLVGHKSMANYHLTNFAVPSLLEAKYVADENGLVDQTGKGFIGTVRSHTFNNRASTLLKDMGYRIITVRSRTKHFNVADAEVYSLEGAIVDDEFEEALLDSTLLPRLFENRLTKKLIRKYLLEWLDADSTASEMLRRILSPNRSSEDFVVTEVARLSSSEDPMFVMAHLFVPHQPYLFGRNGELPEVNDWVFGEPENIGPDVQGYADQIHYLNKLLRGMIDTILANSTTPPIIILQSDHGLRLTWWKYRTDPSPARQLEGTCLREIFSNFNAMYLPGSAGPEMFYDSISPVNTFRLVFDAYFGAELGLLEDRSFFVTKTGGEKSLDIKDITASRDSCDPVWKERFRKLHQDSQ